MMKSNTYTLHDYVELPYQTIFKEDSCEGKSCVVAYNPELEGCMASGWTWQEALANLKDARTDYIKAHLDMGWEVPTPQPTPTDVVVCERGSVRADVSGSRESMPALVAA